LAGEIVFADPRDKPGDAADLLEHRQRLARRIQGLALPAGEDARGSVVPVRHRPSDGAAIPCRESHHLCAWSMFRDAARMIAL
jgi:hypothetical protein